MQPSDFVVPPDSGAVSLAAYDTASKAGFDSKKDARKILARDVEKLCELQDKFAAQTSRALLIVLQGMDAAGKDGIIKHVMTGLNPQGVNVYGFRAPTTRRSPARFLVAREQGFARARAHRDLQPFVLRRSAGRARASGDLASAGREQPGPGYVGAALRRHQRLRAPSNALRHDRAQVLSASFERRAARAIAVPPRDAG